MKLLKWWYVLGSVFILGSMHGVYADTEIDGTAMTSSSFTMTGTVSISSLTAANISAQTITVSTLTVSNQIIANVTNSSMTLQGLTVDSITINSQQSGIVLGKFRQIKSATTATGTATTNTSFQNTNLTISITPSSSSNKILLVVSGELSSSNPSVGSAYATITGTTTGNLGNANGLTVVGGNQTTALYGSGAMVALDSPNTTTTQTYTVQIRSQGTITASWDTLGELSSIIAAEVIP